VCFDLILFQSIKYAIYIALQGHSAVALDVDPEASDSLEILVSTEKNEVFVSVAKFLGLDIPALVVIVEDRHEASD
jgi:hypothetical protein